MDIVDLVGGYIESTEGRSVSHQFVDSWEDGDFKSQNLNALKYIKIRVENVIESDLIRESAKVEIEDYLKDLTIFSLETGKQ